MSENQLRATLEAKIHEFVADVLLFGQAPDLDNSTALLELGILDSMGTISLLAFIEEEFAVTIPLEQLEPAQLRDIAAIAETVLHKLS